MRWDVARNNKANFLSCRPPRLGLSYRAKVLPRGGGGGGTLGSWELASVCMGMPKTRPQGNIWWSPGAVVLGRFFVVAWFIGWFWMLCFCFWDRVLTMYFFFLYFKDAIEFILCWPYTGGRVATLFFFSVYSFLLLDILYLTMYFWWLAWNLAYRPKLPQKDSKWDMPASDRIKDVHHCTWPHWVVRWDLSLSSESVA